jgi:hypothetical protein
MRVVHYAILFSELLSCDSRLKIHFLIQLKSVTLTDVDINTSDTSTPIHNQISGSISAPTKQSGILVPTFFFILFGQWKHVFSFFG